MELPTHPDQLADDAVIDRLGPWLAGPPPTRPAAHPSVAAARDRLDAFVPDTYARTRNHLRGNVSGLNPYVTWGVWTLAEVAGAVRSRPGSTGDHGKFLQELAWKAYFRACFGALGGRVHRSLEPYKYPRTDELDGEPPGATTGTTGISSIDWIARELLDTGHLHNHARLWFASWWVHFARRPWTTGARFFQAHLFDGEPGPNALSWQWVASTYSAKPYVVRGDNLRRFGLDPGEGAPFDGDEASTDATVFGGFASGGHARRTGNPPSTRPGPHRTATDAALRARPVVVLHGERLSPHARVVRELPDRPVVVVLEGRRFQAEGASPGRTSFAVHLAADVVETLKAEGRDAYLVWADRDESWTEAIERLGGDSIAAPDSWHPGTWSTFERLAKRWPVTWIPDEPFVDVHASLKSFSSFWSVAEGDVTRRWKPTPSQRTGGPRRTTDR